MIKYIVSIYLLFFTTYLNATFSIVAVDTNTGEVGSAGGSCIANSIIISDIHPGVGVIHTQSYWSGYNQLMASDLMDNGLSPDEIIDYIVENDVSNNPLIRQYLVFHYTRNQAFLYLEPFLHTHHILFDQSLSQYHFQYHSFF